MHSASVTVEQQLVSQINKGVLVFAAVGKDDTPKEAETLAAKVLKLRMWSNDDAMVRAVNSTLSVSAMI